MTTLHRALQALFSPEVLWIIGTAIGAGIVAAGVKLWRGLGEVERRIHEEPPS